MNQSFFRACGRLGHLTKHPDQATPTELDRLADVYLLQGRRGNHAHDWLTTSQLESRSNREAHLAEAADVAASDTGDWFGHYYA